MTITNVSSLGRVGLIAHICACASYRSGGTQLAQVCSLHHFSTVPMNTRCRLRTHICRCCQPSCSDLIIIHPSSKSDVTHCKHSWIWNETELMGHALYLVPLQRTSISVNIKERLDFSCALFGPDGSLVANAPHLPVHLGAMSEAVRFQVGDEWRKSLTTCLVNALRTAD